MSPVRNVSRIALICRDARALAEFYESAFDCARVGETAIAGSAFSELLALPEASAQVVSLQMGEQSVELMELQPSGRPYPQGITGRSPLFQHFAIVVADMDAAFARLCAVSGWSAISVGGPQALPPSSGGVTAYKFRDPEGHPLELLEFPRSSEPARWRQNSGRIFLGIDHSAISVADTARSTAFYEQLGLRRSAGSLNVGPAQDRLDGIAAVRVVVTSLALPSGTPPHLELLCYEDASRSASLPGVNDVAATRLVLRLQGADSLNALCRGDAGVQAPAPVSFPDGSLRVLLRDPDGHLLCFEVPAR